MKLIVILTLFLLSAGCASGLSFEPLVEPGEYEILIGKKEGEWVNWSPDTILQKVKLEGSQDYYFRMNIDNGEVGFFVLPMPYAPIVLTSGQSRVMFEMVEVDKVKEEISKTKFLPESTLFKTEWPRL